MEAKSRQMPVHTSKQARRAMEQQTPMGSSDISSWVLNAQV